MLQKILRKLAWRLGSATGVRLLRGLVLEQMDAASAACDAGYTLGFQSASALQRFARDPESEISPAFVANALGHGDRCYGICRDGRLVASSWYSTRPTPISPDVVLHFDPQYVYMYKAFTRPSHRGQRLYAAGVSRALQHYLAQGARGLVCYVDVTNLGSLKACLRMGYRIFGSVCLLKLFGRQFAFSTAGCKAFGFRVEVTGTRPMLPAKEAPLGR